MTKVEMYPTGTCPYSIAAKKLLEKKGVSFSEFRIEKDPDRAAGAKQRSGGRETLPQIFIDREHVGGHYELSTMDQKGELDRRLGLS
jgi:glutaredoxin 3